MSHIRRQSDTSLSPATSSSSHLRPEKRPGEDDPHAHDATAKVAKRAQVSRACQRCRNLRRACSDYRPCKRCSDHGLADQCLGMPGPVQITWAQGHIAGAAAATSPQAYVLPPAQDSVQRLAHLLPVTVVNYCARRFFARLYPTIPIVTAEYIGRLKAAAASSTPSEVAMEAQLVLAAMSALILLQVEEPESLFNEGLIAEKNSAYGERLFDEAILAHRHFARKSNPSLALCLLTFLLYACHAALLHHSQAFLFLREANTLWLLLRPRDDDAEVRALADRLFWVLLISERSHAVRYRRPVTLQITPETPSPGPDDDDPSLRRLLVPRRPLPGPSTTSFVALLNKEQVAAPPSPGGAPTTSKLAVNAAFRRRCACKKTQKANLGATQLWRPQLHFYYRSKPQEPDPFDAGLAFESIRSQGAALTEKLFDITSSVVDVLARIPLTPSSPNGIGIGAEDDLNYIRRLITQLPGGPAIYDALLDKHIQQAVPDMELGEVQNLSD
ncbi:conserved hypothetical protein [Verticillium alfalfae VaMs.102]|uniref:Zn(2)-C6 fungal-type domain-containing protein n=1 Tax=Verticillium alfalfae (strain VaMs.102 / ATCC MYA-4576 / FGSC 10136) TaxID=526221 RepID=C9SYV2_VERA1|nr:conserved hypothetical protein [Verticillium alfalfae VaMs.102]EEY23967.1 conserved hypothetical protein [Verticillium alfalfae VaMs.102]